MVLLAMLTVLLALLGMLTLREEHRRHSHVFKARRLLYHSTLGRE